MKAINTCTLEQLEDNLADSLLIGMTNQHKQIIPRGQVITSGNKPFTVSASMVTAGISLMLQHKNAQ